MTCFYIDTTSNYLYTGLVKNNQLIIEKKLCLSHDLSVFAQEEISKMFKEVNIEPDDVDKIIVVNGPGSFTGIRIGVTLAKIYAWALKKEITTITSLEAMMASVNSDKLIVPIINARRNACYAGIYKNNICLLEPSYITIEKLLLILNGYQEDYILVSNDTFNNLDCTEYNPDILKIVNMYQDKESINSHLVNPIYLKLTEAEESKMKED